MTYPRWLVKVVIMPPGPGSVVVVINKASRSLAACRPSAMAQTTSDCPLRQSENV